MRERPETIGALVWPYQCASWNVSQRLERIAGHAAVIDELGPPWLFPTDHSLQISDLSEYAPDMRLIMDQPIWFMREGGLVLNLFQGDFRAFSLAFSFYQTPGGRRHAVIGGLQGRDRDDVLDLYRDLTKAFYGLRPRDLLFEAFRMICRRADVDEVYAVTQAQRHHQHRYFGDSDFSLDYDRIWQDREGVRVDDDFYRFDVAPPRRDLATVKPNKRSLYRKRFAFLDTLEAQIRRDLPGLKPIQFESL